MPHTWKRFALHVRVKQFPETPLATGLQNFSDHPATGTRETIFGGPGGCPVTWAERRFNEQWRQVSQDALSASPQGKRRRTRTWTALPLTRARLMALGYSALRCHGCVRACTHVHPS